MSEDTEEHKRHVRLTRKLAREEAYDVLVEYLDDYEHMETAASEVGQEWMNDL